MRGPYRSRERSHCFLVLSVHCFLVLNVRALWLLGCRWGPDEGQEEGEGHSRCGPSRPSNGPQTIARENGHQCGPYGEEDAGPGERWDEGAWGWWGESGLDGGDQALAHHGRGAGTQTRQVSARHQLTDPTSTERSHHINLVRLETTIGDHEAWALRVLGRDGLTRMGCVCQGEAVCGSWGGSPVLLGGRRYSGAQRCASFITPAHTIHACPVGQFFNTILLGGWLC